MSNLLSFPTPDPNAQQDAQARLDALDIHRSFIVEAPAGSGKTGLLIQRFLKLLASESVTDPSQLLAITFTRKATAEMRDRVLAQLAAAAADTPPANDFDRLTRPLAEAALARDRALSWNLLSYPRRLNIATIDSVCGDIARALPVLSGAGGALTPTQDAGTLHAEAARRTLMLLGGSDRTLHAALETVLLHRDANLSECASLIEDMLTCRDQWGELIPVSGSVDGEELDDAYLETVVLPRLEKALDHAICVGLTRLSKALPSSILTSLCMLAADMGHADGYDGNPSPIAICAGRYDAPEEKSEHLEHWRALIHLLITPSSSTVRKSANSNHIQFQIRPEHRKQLLEITQEVDSVPGLCEELCAAKDLPPAQYPREQWLVTKALFHVLRRALIELQIVFAERGECDFIELALLAKSALRHAAGDPPENHGEIPGMALQHLLVDEMQDTSSAQYELIQLLTERWDGASQTVFLVGDPKQSIYLFRQARVERFVQTMHATRLGDLPLTVLHLTRNFRSQATLVADFNTDFTSIFPPRPNPAQPELVPYLRASSTRPPNPSAGARVWHTRALPRGTDASVCQSLALEDAATIRSTIERWRSRPLPPGRTEPWKLAVLVRNRSHLTGIIPALKQAPAIPFRAIDIEPLAERQEILDLLALTRALLHPADRTAWLALLRTPWVGLPLADLHVLAGSDDRTLRQTSIPTLIATRGDFLQPDSLVLLEKPWKTMVAAWSERGRFKVARWVERTWRTFLAHHFLTPEELGNTDQFFSLLSALEAEARTLTIDLLDARLKNLYAAPSLAAEAVDLLTIHKAKGLEWDLVIVPALDRTGRVSTTRLLSWLEVDAGAEFADPSIAPGILAPIQSKGTDSKALNCWMRSIESARESAERKRLFYVATTRAREELHLFATLTENAAGTLKPKPDSLLAAAWPAAESSFTTYTIPIPTALSPYILQQLAAQSASPAPRMIQRIPLSPALPPAPRILPYALLPPSLAASFERPDGSFAARAFGNAVHAFLEVLTARIAEGDTTAALLAGLPGWQARVTAVLRASGLPPTTVQTLTARVLHALTNTLGDADGQWILAPHPQALTEASLSTAQSSLRFDRTFLAGSTPSALGETYRWIVDYKTASLGGRDLTTFLADESAKYAPQMTVYADAVSAAVPGASPVRLALYYPMIPHLHWWDPAATHLR